MVCISVCFSVHIDPGHLNNLPFIVPRDLLDPVIWALKMLMRVVTECSDEQLCACGHMSRGQDAERTKQFMVSLRAYMCARIPDSMT